jgi:hypothetical protein
MQRHPRSITLGLLLLSRAEVDAAGEYIGIIFPDDVYDQARFNIIFE